MPEAQAPAPQPQVTIGTKPHDWKKVSLTILVILVVAGLIVAAYWFLVLNKSSDENDLTGPVPKATTNTATESAKESTESAEKDETADWKTYTNEKLGFSLKYPEELSLNEVNNTVELDNYNQIGFGRPDEVTFRGNEIEDIFIGITISVEILDQGTSLEEYLDKKFPVNKDGLPSYQSLKEKFKNINIDQEPGFLSETGMLFENKQRITWVKKDSKLFIITAYGSGETGTYPSKIAEETFDRILSTFKFLD